MKLREQINFWKEELLSPNQNDVLVNLQSGKNAFRSEDPLPADSFVSVKQNHILDRIVKKHFESLKETGTPVFGSADSLMRFNLDNNAYSCPIFVAGCSVKRNRFNKTYKIELSEDYYLNPFLVKILELPSTLENVDALRFHMEESGLEYTIEEGFWLANFHPHRFILLKELELLGELKNLSPGLKQIMGFGEASDSALELHEGLLFPADEDQLKIFDEIQKENLVIQGPPGTGKSQVISNILGKILAGEKKGILVAEKKVALEVIFDKLKTHNLHHYCLLYHHELKSKDFISSLEQTWKMLEQHKTRAGQYENYAKHEIAGLSLSLERLDQPGLIGGLSYSEFLKKMPEDTKEGNLFFAGVPEIPVWEKDMELLIDLQNRGMPLNGSWLKLKWQKSPDFMTGLDEAINNVRGYIHTLGFDTLSVQELDNEIKRSSLATLFFYDDLLIPTKVLKTDSVQQKKFERLFGDIQSLEEKYELLKDEKEHWSKNFSLTELEEYLRILSSGNRFNLRTRFHQRKLLKFTDLNIQDGKKAIQNLIDLKKVEKNMAEVREEFRNMGLSTDINELRHIHYVIRRTRQADQNVVKMLSGLPSEELSVLKDRALLLGKCSDFVRKYFIPGMDTDIIQVIKDLQSELSVITKNLGILADISSETKNLLRYEPDLNKGNLIVFQSHWRNFVGLYPNLAQFDGIALLNKVEKIIDVQQREAEQFADYIHYLVQARFLEFHKLLQTPAAKLSEENKAFKKKLRKGKSILVKAFGKSRNLPSMRELLLSDAEPWIYLLKPIFLCSPYSVAKSIPLENVFDVVVFDEASQIPLPHAVGSIQRARRIVVAGDRQQMAPQFYFQKRSSVQLDLLHQADYYWPNFMLTNHYRSIHNELIAFSNRYFYENKLKTYPSPVEKKAVEVLDAGGIYHDRVNKKEASLAAEVIQTAINHGHKDFGIVAFSQTQLQEIMNNLSAETRDLLMEDDANMLIQSLENVQGDQCEHLIISMGYARNENGEFRMQFGPLNQEQGHRRLNVLMSRARSKITFIRSVNSDDFKISDNEGVEMLRKLMLFLEEEKVDNNKEFPFDLKPKISENNLLIRNPQAFFPSAHALINFHAVMKSRGWNPEYSI
ncbi:MAG: ATP-binding protein [Brumimicrobium sp.]|nr:ATP-binding protein [Brumimicrobium sp.]